MMRISHFRQAMMHASLAKTDLLKSMHIFLFFLSALLKDLYLLLHSIITSAQCSFRTFRNKSLVTWLLVTLWSLSLFCLFVYFCK